jgi:hypothetical protein
MAWVRRYCWAHWQGMLAVGMLMNGLHVVGAEGAKLAVKRWLLGVPGRAVR